MQLVVVQRIKSVMRKGDKMELGRLMGGEKKLETDYEKIRAIKRVDRKLTGVSMLTLSEVFLFAKKLNVSPFYLLGFSDDPTYQNIVFDRDKATESLAKLFEYYGTLVEKRGMLVCLKDSNKKGGLARYRNFLSQRTFYLSMVERLMKFFDRYSFEEIFGIK